MIETLPELEVITDSEADQKRKDEYKHFIWLVKYQVEGLSYDAVAEWQLSKIAEELREQYGDDYNEIVSQNHSFDITQNTIKDAVRNTAKLIGLTLRKGKRGRPRNGPS